MASPEDREMYSTVTGVVTLVVADEPTGPLGMSVRVVCVAGGDLGRTFRITSSSVVIGRGSVDVALRSHDVSRHHARISRQDAGFLLEDLGSANGTYLNAARLDGSAPLRIGDRIQIGSTILVFAHHDELEERMRQLQRLEALGTLAGGLAHDFNNALAVILGSLDHLAGQLSPDQSEPLEIIQEIKSAASSAASLAKRLLRLARTEPVAVEPVPLAPVIERVASTMRRQAGATMTVSTRVAADLTVLSSFEDLHQVLLNLLFNARDAMPDGGAVNIGARAVRFEAAQALARLLPAAGDYVEITVTDTGVGMDEATLARAFDPFFTTKPPGEGTGLGLAMIHYVVRAHGGTVAVESTPKHGTTFRILLPASS